MRGPPVGRPTTTSTASQQAGGPDRRRRAPTVADDRSRRWVSRSPWFMTSPPLIDDRRSPAKEGGRRSDRSIVGPSPFTARDICHLIQQLRWHPPRHRTQLLDRRIGRVIISSKADIQRPKLRVREGGGRLPAARRTFCNETAGQALPVNGGRTGTSRQSGDDFPEEQDVRLGFPSLFGRQTS
jgi:hypothetical protein